MKGLDKLTPIRLAEVLTQKGVIPTEAITEALYAQDKLKEPFVELLVNGGHVTEWDLAKIVVEHFQLPFIMASNYDVLPEVKTRLPEEVVFRHTLVPLDMFGDVIVVAMPILTSFEVLDKIQRQHSCELFPYVGLVSENKKVIGDLLPSYGDWQKKQQALKERRVSERAAKPEAGGGGREGGAGPGWMNIFDSADAAVRQGMSGSVPKAPPPPTLPSVPHVPKKKS